MVMAFVLKKLPVRKKQSNQEEIKEDTIDDSAESRREETLKKDETNITEDTTITTDRIETTETESNPRMDIVDIGICSISTIFLIATIIFFIIFIKHQQKTGKKLSK
ncbi:MAG: hypothetical protein HFJ51_04620, partial [Clostridia bacterium]|nr:hypothetical protein [Clostridia bacterium]